MVHRLLGLKRLPDVAIVSRTLAGLDEISVTNLRRLNRQRILDQLGGLGLARLTLDFDGSVLSTGRFAEGTAVGFNRKKKGQRSYYPLFCTIAQTGQVLDVWHRPGNVHDSIGARDFILACVRQIKAILPRCKIEARMDSAFFSDDIVRMLDAEGVEFTISVPFERFATLKGLSTPRPPTATGTPLGAPGPAAPHAHGPQVKTCLTCSWLHSLKGWSLRKTRGGSPCCFK